MDIIKQLQWRYATKMFDKDKKISKEDFDELLEVARLAPASFGLQSWRAMVIKSPEVRSKLKEAGYNQSQITDASELVIFAAPKKIEEKDVDAFIKLVADTRSASLESLDGYKKMIAGSVAQKAGDESGKWAAKQAYIALGFLLETAALKNIDACPMEGFDHEKFDQVLGLDKKGYQSQVMCALGYRSNEDSYIQLKKVRFSKKDLFEEI